MSPREKRGPVRSVLRSIGRLGMLLVLLVGALFVSLGLANVGRDRPTTQALDSPAPSSSASTGSAATSAGAGVPSGTEGSAADLVEREDTRLLRLVRQLPYGVMPYVARTGRVNTLVLTPSAETYERDTLRALGALTRLEDGSDYLSESVLVAPGATLDLGGRRLLRMRSDASAFTSIVAWKGGLQLAGSSRHPLRITSWDIQRGTPDLSGRGGRAYLRSVDSTTVVRNVRLDRLGFWSGRTGGLAVEGAAVAKTATPRATPADAAPQLDVDGLETHHLHYGLYTDNIDSASVEDARLLDSERQGLLLHGESRNVTIASSTVHGNGDAGIAVTRGSHDVTMRGVDASGNDGDGIRIDGRPIADGATAGGGDSQARGDVEVTRSRIEDNAGSGLAIIGAVRVAVSGSDVSSGSDAVTVRDRAAGVRLFGNRLSAPRGFGVTVTDGPTAVRVQDNVIRGATTGVLVRRAAATVSGNTVTAATAHGVSLVGAAAGSRVVRNSLSGAGASAIDLHRLVRPATVVVGANRVAGWDVVKDLTWQQRLEEHPLLALWLPILLLPLVAGLVTLRRRRGHRPTARRRVTLAAPPPGRTAFDDHPSSTDEDDHSRTRVTVMS